MRDECLSAPNEGGVLEVCCGAFFFLFSSCPVVFCLRCLAVSKGLSKLGHVLESSDKVQFAADSRRKKREEESQRNSSNGRFTTQPQSQPISCCAVSDYASIYRFVR